MYIYVYTYIYIYIYTPTHRSLAPPPPAQGFLAEGKVPGSVPLLSGIVQPYAGEVMAPFPTSIDWSSWAIIPGVHL